MTTGVIFGGAGFIGTHLARALIGRGLVERVVIADLRPSSLVGMPGVEAVFCDVREPIPAPFDRWAPQWVINLAAVHREPGHAPSEYAETNVVGAEHVCAYAHRVATQRLLFTSSIAVYGAIGAPVDESGPLAPRSPYGESKVAAEAICRRWQRAADGRRLVVVRPSVVFGPGDTGNFARMIRAIRGGYFVVPGLGRTVKSYAYVGGLVDVLLDALTWPDPSVTFNYADYPSQPLTELVAEVRRAFAVRWPSLRLPLAPVLAGARVLHALLGERAPMHPLRVEKAARTTAVIPTELLRRGWRSSWTFAAALADWRRVAPQDFAPATPAAVPLAPANPSHQCA